MSDYSFLSFDLLVIQFNQSVLPIIAFLSNGSYIILELNSSLHQHPTVGSYRRGSPGLGLGHWVPLCQGGPEERVPHKPVHLVWKHTATTLYMHVQLDLVFFFKLEKLFKSQIVVSFVILFQT